MSRWNRGTVLMLLCLALLVIALLSRSFFYSSNSDSVSAHVRGSDASDSLSGTTGKTFPGTVIRKFPAGKRKFVSFKQRKVHTPIRDPWCKFWAVMTTIFEPSDSVRRQVKLNNWCLVVVADKKTPEKYETGWIPGEGNDRVVYLSLKTQESMHGAFVQSIPWNHFGRKNIGYLFAIKHGATTIWDFDDDNMLKFWLPGAAPDGAPSIYTAIPAKDVESIEAIEPQGHNWPTYNPYPVLGAPTLPSWPRGIPLSDIKEPRCNTSGTKTVTLKTESIAVLQSLADFQPDVDAIYRITMPIPFSFKRTTETKPLMVPTGVLTPYNAQATLHFQPSFYALFLPITVNGRVSDIWRSYFAQRLFWDTGHKFGFVARPLVVQDRNPHSNLGDLEAERGLYQKSKQLVQFLGSWRGNGKTIVERMEELFIALYERQYIEEYDVKVMQLWLQSLIDAGYRFPEVKDTPFTVPKFPEL